MKKNQQKCGISLFCWLFSPLYNKHMNTRMNKTDKKNTHPFQIELVSKKVSNTIRS